MKRKEIEEYIAKELSEKLKEHGFLLTKASYTGERYVEFELKKENVTYQWSVVFKKYGNIDVFLTIYYEAISKLYKQLSREIIYRVSNTNINSEKDKWQLNISVITPPVLNPTPFVTSNYPFP